MRAESGRGRSRPPLCRAHPPTGTLIDTASFPALAGCVVLEDSPSQVYGAALLMRFGSDPIRSSNLRSSAERRPMLVELRSTAPVPAVSSRGDDPPDPPMRASPACGWLTFGGLSPTDPPMSAAPTCGWGLWLVLWPTRFRLPPSGAGAPGTKLRLVPGAPSASPIGAGRHGAMVALARGATARGRATAARSAVGRPAGILGG
jgi:hypothetical protein